VLTAKVKDQELGQRDNRTEEEEPTQRLYLLEIDRNAKTKVGVYFSVCLGLALAKVAGSCPPHRIRLQFHDLLFVL
jgi:hypothetical protein